MTILFKDTIMIITQVDDFLDSISQGIEIFKLGVKDYLESEMDKFEERRIAIGELENKADDLRRNIESQLYGHSLIPEQRGDVLGLLEHMDNIIDTAKETITQFSIETPEIPAEFNKDFLELSEISAQTCESLVLAARAFFRDVKVAKDHLHKVHFYEKEGDKTADRLKRRIFKLDIDLSRKFHLRYFAHQVDKLSDLAEEVADRLAIIVIKRTM